MPSLTCLVLLSRARDRSALEKAYTCGLSLSGQLSRSPARSGTFEHTMLVERCRGSQSSQLDLPNALAVEHNPASQLDSPHAPAGVPEEGTTLASAIASTKLGLVSIDLVRLALND